MLHQYLLFLTEPPASQPNEERGEIPAEELDGTTVEAAENLLFQDTENEMQCGHEDDK